MSSDTHNSVPTGLLTRDGRLSELAIDRYLLDDLSPVEKVSVDAHLANDPSEAARVTAVRAFDSEVTLAPPSAAPAPVIDLAARRRRRRSSWAVGGALLAAAAAVTFFVARGPAVTVPVSGPGDGVRFKGAALELEVFAHDGADARAVSSGEVVYGGERFGFRVTAKEGGYLVIAGADGAGEAYLCYPQKNQDNAAWIEGGEPHVLKEAMRFDMLPGHERLVSVVCDEPFAFDAVKQALTEAASGLGADQPLPLLLVGSGCRQAEVVLDKRVRGGGR